MTFHFAIGTAGSTSLVLQAILPALLVADGPSRVVIEGGTHNAWAPPFDFLTRAYLSRSGSLKSFVTIRCSSPRSKVPRTRMPDLFTSGFCRSSFDATW